LRRGENKKYKTMNKLKTVLVVGAGLGGITAALRFAKKLIFCTKIWIN